MLEKLLVPLVAGLFGFLPILLQWISERSKTRSKNHQISRLMGELDFLEKWAGLSVESDDAQKTASAAIQQDLDRILKEYRLLSSEGPPQPSTGPAQISFVRRSFLLFRASTGTGWLIHTLFYFLMLFALATLVSGLVSPIIDPDTGENQFHYLLLGMIVIFGPILLILQRAAIRIRNREQLEL